MEKKSLEGERPHRILSKGYLIYVVIAYWMKQLFTLDPGKEGRKMLSKIPLDLGKIPKGNLDKEILRAGIIAELDAINLYEQMATVTANKNIRAILLDIAREEKTHVGEFQALLLKEDEEFEKEIEEGRKEVEKETGK